MSAFTPPPRQVYLHDLLLQAGVACELPAVAAAIVVQGISDDSRAVAKGDLYLALRGARADGRAFIAQAIDRGAVAVLAESDDTLSIPDNIAIDSSAAPVPVLAVRHLRALAGEIAAHFHGEPSAAMRVIAVTGTNGKTTTTWLATECLDALGERGALIGTLGVGTTHALEATRNTTPGAVELQGLFAGLNAAGFTAVAMEASSIGIEQHRMAGTRIAVAVFTNLSRDHLDYHGTMEAYADAKAQLFAWKDLAGAVLNGDDAVALNWLASGRVRAARVLTYGDAGRGHDIGLVSMQPTRDGSRLALDVGGVRVDVGVTLVGRYNASNIMAVIGAMLLSGYELNAVVKALRRVRAPTGRLETLGGNGAPLCVVDYAHSPDALDKVLSALRETTRGKLWCVFGCGGNRDAGKRPQMGEIAARGADRVIVTSDNPRHESPDAIIADILAGIDAVARTRVTVENDRAAAIARSVFEAAPDDVILIAGKGHENYQEIGDVRLPFFDQDIVRGALAARRDNVPVLGQERNA